MENPKPARERIKPKSVSVIVESETVICIEIEMMDGARLSFKSGGMDISAPPGVDHRCYLDVTVAPSFIRARVNEVLN